MKNKKSIYFSQILMSFFSFRWTNGEPYTELLIVYKQAQPALQSAGVWEAAAAKLQQVASLHAIGGICAAHIQARLPNRKRGLFPDG